MKKIGFFLLILMACTTSVAEIYTWKDSQGVTHFSDIPHSGAESVNLPDTQSYSAPKPSTAVMDAIKDDEKSAPHKYNRIEVVEPQNQSTIRNNDGSIAVSVALEPALMGSDLLELIFDGAPIGKPQNALYFQMENVNRGSHTIAVQVVDDKHNVIDKSDGITVFLQRPRVNMAPSNPKG